MTWLDWLVIAVYFAGTTWLGHRLAGRQAGAEDFFLGGGRVPWYAVAGSLIATTVSAVTFVGVPAIVFGVGGDMTYLQLGLVAGLLARVFVALVLIPAYYRQSDLDGGRLFSPYDYMGARLGGGARGAMTALFSLGGVVAQAARVYLTAMILALVLAGPLGRIEAATGIDPLVTAVGLVTAVAVLWTLMGGIAAVIWTDLILFGVLVVGGLTALGVILARLDGGPSEYLAVGSAAGKFRVFDLGLELSPTKEFTVWSAAIGTTFANVGSYGTDQLLAQRLLCCRDQREAKKAMLASYVGEGVVLLMLLVGVGLFVFHKGAPAVDYEVGTVTQEFDLSDPAAPTPELRRRGVVSVSANRIGQTHLEMTAGAASAEAVRFGVQDKPGKATVHIDPIETPPEAWRRPLPAGRAAQYEENGDNILPIFILSGAIPPGVTGLILAGIFAAAVSSLDSILAALAQTSVALLPGRIEGGRAVRLGRLFAVGWAAVLAAVAVGIGWYQDRFDLPILALALGLAAMVQGGLLAAFFLAWLPLGRWGVNGRGLVWSGPLSVLCVAALRFHSAPAVWTFSILGGVWLATWVGAVLLGDPARRRRRLLVTPAAVVGAALPGLIAWRGYFDDGVLAWTWWALFGGVIAFGFGYVLADPKTETRRGFEVLTPKPTHERSDSPER